MKQFNYLSKALQTISTKNILQFNINRYFYFTFLVLTALHYWIAVLPQNHSLTKIIQYFQPSMYIQGNVLIYFLFIACVVPSMMIVWQFYLSLKHQSLNYSTFEKYQILVVGNICFFMVTFGMLPLIRVCIKLINSQAKYSATYLIALITLVSYLVILLPSYNLFIIDFSSVSQNIYSSLYFINPVRLYPFFRLVVSLDYIINKDASIITVTICFVMMLFLTIWRPLWHYNYGFGIRLIIYGTSWIMLVRIIGAIDGKPVEIGMIIVGTILFVLFSCWISDFQIKKLLQREDSYFPKIKALLFIMNNLSHEDQYLGYYLMNHRKQCSNVSCPCSEIKGQIKQSKCYQMLIGVMNQHYNWKRYSQFGQSQRKKELDVMIEYSRAKCAILSRKLRKWHGAHYYVERAFGQIEKLGRCEFSFRVFRFQLKLKMQLFLLNESIHQGAVNNFAKKYYQFHVNLINIFKTIKNSVKAHLQLWKQLNKHEYEDQEILRYISRSFRTNQRVQNMIKQFKNSSKLQIKFNVLFTHYDNAICNENDQPIQEMAPTPAFIDQNLKLFHLEARTSFCLISLNYNTFGNIMVMNNDFEQFTNLNENSNINQLTLPQMNLQNNQMLHQFIHSDKFNVSFNQMIIKTSKQNIKMVDIYIELVPSLDEGFRAVLFIINQHKKPLFIAGQNGKIFYYSEELQMLVNSNQMQLSLFISLFGIYSLNKIKQERQKMIKIGNQSCFIRMQKEIVVNSMKNEKLYVMCLQQMGRMKYEEQSYIGEQSCDQKLNDENDKVKLIDKKENASLMKHNEQEGLLDKKNMKDTFEIINSQKESFNLLVWRIVVGILIILIISGSCYFISFSKERKQKFWFELWQRHKFHKMTDFTQDSLYYLRKCNIEAITNKSLPLFQLYAKKFNSSNYQAMSVFSNLTVDYTTKLLGFQIVPELGKINVVDSNFYISLKQKIFLAISRLQNVTLKEMAIPLKVSQWSKPYSNVQTNFIQSTLNGYYSALPIFQQIVFDINQNSNCGLGKCTYSEHIQVLAIALLALILAFIIYTLLLNQKFKSIKDQSYHLINQLTNQQISARYQKAKIYYSNIFGESQQIKKIKKQDYSALSIIPAFQSSRGQMFNKSSLVIGDADETQRNDIKDKQTKRIKNGFKKTYLKVFDLVKHRSLKLSLKLMVILVPIMGLMMGIIIYQSNESNSFYNTILNHDILHNRMKLLKTIKMYALQIGLNENFYQSNITLTSSQILIAKIQKLYLKQRQLITQIINGPITPFLKDTIRRYNDQNVCQFISEFKKTSTIEISFTKTQCENINGKEYLKHGMRTAVIGFMEDARQLYELYKNRTLTSLEALNFVKETNHRTLNILDNYFQAIISYHYGLLKIDFLARLNAYVANILALSLVIIFTSIMTLYCLQTFFAQQMHQYKIQIKAAIYVISQSTIKDSKQLNRSITKDIDYRFLR